MATFKIAAPVILVVTAFIVTGRFPHALDQSISRNEIGRLPVSNENTGNEFDIAIQGEGFFQILLPGGTFRYTRDGSFRPNSAGQLVTADGYVVEPQINIPADSTSITFGNDGVVSVVTASKPNVSTIIGELHLTRFPNQRCLSPEGSNLFCETSASGEALQGAPGTDGFGSLQQGFLERPDIQFHTNSIPLIAAQRTFEANQRAVLVSTQTQQVTNRVVR